MAHPSECQVIPQVFGQIYCQSFNCSNRAAYSVGRCIGPISLKMNICEQCAIDLLTNVPEGLRDKADAVLAARQAEAQKQANEAAAELAAQAEAEEAAKPVFVCSKCGATFKNGLTHQSHEKKCSGGGK